MTRTDRWTIFSALALLAAPVAPAAAQGVFDPGVLTVSLGAGALQQSEERRAHRGSHTSRRSAVRPRSAQATQPANPAVLRFQPDPAARQRNLQQYVASLRQTDPAGANGVQQAFAKHDIIADAEASMRAQGLDPHNFADAMAAYIVTAWYGTRGSTDSKPADFKAVARQLSIAVARTPKVQQISNAQKQQLAESMLLSAFAVEATVVQTKKTNPAALKQVGATIAGGARKWFGFDLSRMRLGPNGLS